MSACQTTTAHNNVCVPLLFHGKPECCLIANAEPPEDNNNNSQDCGQEAEFLGGGTSNRPKNYLISGILGSRKEDWFASRAKPACRRRRRRRRRGDLCRWPHAMQSSFVIYNRISFRSTVLGPGGVLKRVPSKQSVRVEYGGSNNGEHGLLVLGAGSGWMVAAAKQLTKTSNK